jgi:superfamily II DNA helicase RecQ
MNIPLCRYAICGDQTIKKFAVTRPSTKARLANIDGVNQVCLNNGDNNVCFRVLVYLLLTND